jgi:hypothetical protein
MLWKLRAISGHSGLSERHPTIVGVVVPAAGAGLRRRADRCGTCGSQLVYSQNKGNGGIYEYFVCPRNQRSECPQGYKPVDLVEAAIEDHYATVPFSEAEREEVRKEVTDDLGKRVATAHQAIFNALVICDEAITGAEFTEPFAALRALHDAVRGLPSSTGPLAERRKRRQRCPENSKGPDPYWGREPFRVGSISETLVRMRGLEPPPGCPDTDLNRARLPIPPHPRGMRRYRRRNQWAGRVRFCSIVLRRVGRLGGCFASLGAVVLRRYRPGD